MVFLIILPFITALVYLIVKGDDMTKRSIASAQHMKDAQDSYIRQVAGKSGAEQIADAKSLLDSGTITQEEFQALKAKALAS